MKKRDSLHVWKPHKTTIDNKTIFFRSRVFHAVHPQEGMTILRGRKKRQLEKNFSF